MVISPNAVAAARTYARDMSGVPLPEPTADADNGPPEPAHEAAYYLGIGETFRILTRPGQPAPPDMKELSTAVRAVPGSGTWYRRETRQPAGSRPPSSASAICPRTPTSCGHCWPTSSRPWTRSARPRNWTAATCAVTTSPAARQRSAAPIPPAAGNPRA